MDMENGKKSELGSTSPLTPKVKLLGLALVFLRLGALGATVAAALVMGLNKETKTIALAMVGTKPIYQTLFAKFQHTPAFVYFVVANAIASGYNLSVLLLSAFVKCKALGLVVHLTDMVVLALVSTGVAAAATMAELGKNGNYHARWFPICDKFDSFCHRGGAAIMLAIVGTGLFLMLNTLSTIIIYKNVVKP